MIKAVLKVFHTNNFTFKVIRSCDLRHCLCVSLISPLLTEGGIHVHCS